MHFVRNAVVEEIFHVAADKFEGREAADPFTVRLPKRAIDRAPVLPAVAAVAAVAEDFAPAYLFKFGGKHSLIVHDQRCTRIGIDDAPQAWAGLSHRIRMFPKVGQLCSVPANDPE